MKKLFPVLLGCAVLLSGCFLPEVQGPMEPRPLETEETEAPKPSETLETELPETTEPTAVPVSVDNAQFYEGDFQQVHYTYAIPALSLEGAEINDRIMEILEPIVAFQMENLEQGVLPEMRDIGWEAFWKENSVSVLLHAATVSEGTSYWVLSYDCTEQRMLERQDFLERWIPDAEAYKNEIFRALQKSYDSIFSWHGVEEGLFLRDMREMTLETVETAPIFIGENGSFPMLTRAFVPAGGGEVTQVTQPEPMEPLERTWNQGETAYRLSQDAQGLHFWISPEEVHTVTGNWRPVTAAVTAGETLYVLTDMGTVLSSTLTETPCTFTPPYGGLGVVTDLILEDGTACAVNEAGEILPLVCPYSETAMG